MQTQSDEAMMPKKFLREDKWDEKTLFEYAKRHLAAAQILFQNQDAASYALSISSAGYLCHLGVELLLKGCCLYESDSFKDQHNLHILIDDISFIKIDTNLNVHLKNIQQFNEMRYPQDLSNTKVVEDLDINSNLPEEIGDHDWVGTIKLLHEILKQMPAALQEIAKPIFASFDDVLLEKRYLKGGEYLYRLVLDV